MNINVRHCIILYVNYALMEKIQIEDPSSFNFKRIILSIANYSIFYCA